jgi:phage terminase large subunit GpA-like protein
MKLYPEEKQALETRPGVSTKEWATKHFRLVTGQFKGQPFRLDRLPYAAKIFDTFDEPWVRKLYIVGTSQTGKTTIMYACIAAEMWRDPSPAGICMADKDTRDRIFDEKLTKHFKASPLLRRDLSATRNAVQKGEIRLKGATLYGLYAGSEASMSSVTLRILGVDEEDAYADKTAVTTVEERVLSYEGDNKVIRISKPRGDEDDSTIWRDMKAECQVIYEIEARCPVCGAYQIMKKDRIKCPSDVREAKEIRGKRLAWYECEHCHAKWTDVMRDRAVAAGRCVSKRSVARPTAVGFHLPEWVSPNVSLSKTLADWFKAREDGTPKAMTAFDNNCCARPGKVVSVETSEDRVRAMIRPDLPPLVVPADAWAVSVGIDVQQTGFWFVARAWGRDWASWLIQYGFLDTWRDVEQLLDSRYDVEGRDDVVAPVWRAAIDMGGGAGDDEEGWSKSMETKAWIYEHQDILPVHAVKGASSSQQEVVRASRTAVDPDARARERAWIPLRTLDTVPLKDMIHQTRLKTDSAQPMWLHRDTREDYIRQICSEKRRKVNGRSTWTCSGRANHLLDCEVYAAAAVHFDWQPSIRQLAEPYFEPIHETRVDYRVNASPLAGLCINPSARR